MGVDINDQETAGLPGTNMLKMFQYLKELISEEN